MCRNYSWRFFFDHDVNFYALMRKQLAFCEERHTSRLNDSARFLSHTLIWPA